MDKACVMQALGCAWHVRPALLMLGAWVDQLRGGKNFLHRRFILKAAQCRGVSFWARRGAALSGYLA
jgi:hypothetical protein